MKAWLYQNSYRNGPGPFLQSDNELLQHAELLIGIGICEVVSRSYIEKSRRLICFFRSKYSGLQDMEDYVKVEGDEPCCLLNVFPGAMLCVMKCLGENKDSLLYLVDVSACILVSTIYSCINIQCIKYLFMCLDRT